MLVFTAWILWDLNKTKQNLDTENKNPYYPEQANYIWTTGLWRNRIHSFLSLLIIVLGAFKLVNIRTGFRTKVLVVHYFSIHLWGSPELQYAMMALYVQKSRVTVCHDGVVRVVHCPSIQLCLLRDNFCDPPPLSTSVKQTIFHRDL